MTFVLIHYTKQANTLIITATIHFQQLAVFGADFLLRGCKDFNQRALFGSCRLIVGLRVSGTVRGHAHQARSDSLQLRHTGKIIFCIQWTDSILIWRGGLSCNRGFPRQINQHCILLQNRSACEDLSAQGTAANNSTVLLVAVDIYTGHTKAVATLKSYRVI